MSYTEYLSDVEKLRELFVLYAVVSRLKVPVVTVKHSVYKLLSPAPDQFRLNDALVRQRIVEVEAETLGKSAATEFNKRKVEIELRAGSRSVRADRHVSGKDYLMPLLFVRAKMRGCYKENVETLKARLARYYDVSVEPSLKRAIDRVLEVT